MTSPCKSLDVLDFKIEADDAGKDAHTYMFHQDVAQETDFHSEEIGNVLCADAINSGHHSDGTLSYTMLDAVDATKRMSGFDAVPQENFKRPEQLIEESLSSPKQQTEYRPKLEPGRFFSQHQGNFGAASPSSDESCDAVSEVDESMIERSSSTPSDTAEDDGSLYGASTDHCFAGWEMGDSDAVVLNPDYVVYHGKRCRDCVLTFSSSCIGVKGSTGYENKRNVSFQLGIDDIIDIDSEWCGKFGVATVNIHSVPKDVIVAENVHGVSGDEELKFVVIDFNWYAIHEAITSLNVRYKVLWNIVLDINMGRYDEAIPGQSGSSSKCYLPIFTEPFEVVYPKGDSDAVSIIKRDVDLLEPETFVNDTIIDFYIKYLKNKIQPEERHKFHFFNSFFFRKLADLDKNPSSAFEGRAAFLRVCKWTRKVNLFEKDYVFIPVNFNYHWSLIIMCHPGEVAKLSDEIVEKSLKVPCILHLDSIRGSHTGLKDLMQSYLWEEWKEKHKETSEDMSTRFLSLRFLSPELPQQQNSYDCGLFLLHYVELFLEKAAACFSPFKITKFSKFLNADWFQSDEVLLKRVAIQRLIYDLLPNCSREISPATGSEMRCSLNCPKRNIDNGNDADFLSERCGPSIGGHGNLESSEAGLGIEMTLLPTSSLRGSEYANNSGMISTEFFEPGVAAESFLDAQYQAFEQTSTFNEFKSAMTPIEEEVEVSGHLIFAPSMETGFRQLTEITSQAAAFPYASTYFTPENSWNPGISLHQAKHEDTDSSARASSSAYGDSVELEVNENGQVGDDLNIKVKMRQPISPSTENIDGLTECFVSAPSEMFDIADSRCPDQMLDAYDNADALVSSPKNFSEFSHQHPEMQENGGTTSENGHLMYDNSVSELDEQQHAAKKMKLTPFLEGEEEGLERNGFNDLHL